MTELFSADDDKDKKVRLQAQYVHMLSNRIEALKNSVTPELAESVAHFEQLTRAVSLGDTNSTEAPRPAASPAPAKPAPVVAESTSNVQSNGKVWTPEKLAEVKAYREKHGTKNAAEHFKVSTSLIRKKLPSEKPQPKGYSAFSHRMK